MLPGPWEAKRITPLAGDITRIHLPPASAAKAPSLVNVSLSRSSWRRLLQRQPFVGVTPRAAAFASSHLSCQRLNTEGGQNRRRDFY